MARPMPDTWTIRENPGREQPFTVWHDQAQVPGCPIWKAHTHAFFAWRAEAEAYVAKERDRLAS